MLVCHTKVARSVLKSLWGVCYKGSDQATWLTGCWVSSISSGNFCLNSGFFCRDHMLTYVSSNMLSEHRSVKQSGCKHTIHLKPHRPDDDGASSISFPARLRNRHAPPLGVFASLLPLAKAKRTSILGWSDGALH